MFRRLLPFTIVSWLLLLTAAWFWTRSYRSSTDLLLDPKLAVKSAHGGLAVITSEHPLPTFPDDDFIDDLRTNPSV